MMPLSAVTQLRELVLDGKIELVNESSLDSQNRAIYDAAYRNLERVMIDPRRANKNKGEVCSLAYAKTRGIPVFATDEMNLQSIIHNCLCGFLKKMADNSHLSCYMLFLYFKGDLRFAGFRFNDSACAGIYL